MKPIFHGVLIVALSASVGVGETRAQSNPGNHPPTSGGMGPCRMDVDRFCPGKRDISPLAVQDCLVAHFKEISVPCQEHLAQEHVILPGTGNEPDVAICQPDQVRYCPQTPLSDHLDAAYDCLSRHLKELSPGCQPQVQAAQLRAEQAALAKVVQDCQQETARFCRGVKSKGFLLLDCLLGKKVTSGKACKAAIEAARPYRKHRRVGDKAATKP